MRSMAALLASLPRTTSSASSTCHWRTIPFLEGNWVLIDTRLHFVGSNYLDYRERGWNVKWAPAGVAGLMWAGWQPAWRLATAARWCERGSWPIVNRPAGCQPAPHSGKPQTVLAFLR